MGQQIDAGRFTPEYINNIDVSSLPTGMYVLMLQSDNKQVTRKFVKQ